MREDHPTLPSRVAGFPNAKDGRRKFRSTPDAIGVAAFPIPSGPRSTENGFRVPIGSGEMGQKVHRSEAEIGVRKATRRLEDSQ